MKKIYLILFIVIPYNIFAQYEETVNYKGSIGANDIVLEMNYMGNVLHGQYYFKSNDQRVINLRSLKDYFDETDKVIMKEYIDEGFASNEEILKAMEKSGGYFEFSLQNIENYSEQNTLSGKWYSTDGTKIRDVILKKQETVEEYTSNELLYTYKADANDMADIKLKIFENTFELFFKNFNGEYEKTYIGKVTDGTKMGSLTLTFGTDKPYLEALFDKRYDGNDSFTIIDENTLEIDLTYDSIPIWGIRCTRE